MQDYHQFTDMERETVEIFVRILSMSLSRFRAKQENRELKVIAEMQKQLEESLIFTNFFLDTFVSAYYIDLTDRSCKVYKRTEKLEKDYPVITDWLEGITAYIRRDVHPEDREQLLAIVQPDFMRAALAEKAEYTHVFRDISSGEERVYRMQVIRGSEEGQAAFGFMDITADLEEQRLRQKEADEANRAKSAFLFNMSHDIRTPMNAIRGFTAMAKKSAGDHDRVIDYLNKIDVSGQQLLTLINQVLEMARIESGKFELEEIPVSIHEEFNSMVTVLNEQARGKGLQFSYALNNVTHGHVLADEARMSSITLNIAGNAMKYTPEGGTVRFELTEIPAGKAGYATFVFTVADTGIGMSPEYMQKLYEPFSREKSSTVSGIQGSGLGMAVVKSFVELMDGTVSVQSRQGVGTTFTVMLPFRLQEGENYTDPETGEVMSAVTEPVSTAQTDFGGKKVLLVEDNEMNREIATEMLEEEGLTVDDAEDGTVAVAKMQAHGPDYYDFILMDIQMPKMNGYEATAAIRAMYPDRHIPIIALSANAFAEDKIRSMAAGMDDHVAKPINLRELFGSLAKYI